MGCYEILSSLFLPDKHSPAHLYYLLIKIKQAFMHKALLEAGGYQELLNNINILDRKFGQNRVYTSSVLVQFIEAFNDRNCYMVYFLFGSFRHIHNVNPIHNET